MQLLFENVQCQIQSKFIKVAQKSSQGLCILWKILTSHPRIAISGSYPLTQNSAEILTRAVVLESGLGLKSSLRPLFWSLALVLVSGLVGLCILLVSVLAIENLSSCCWLLIQVRLYRGKRTPPTASFSLALAQFWKQHWLWAQHLLPQSANRNITHSKSLASYTS